MYGTCVTLLYRLMYFMSVFRSYLRNNCTELIEEIKSRAPRGTDRSPEYNEYFCYKLDSRVKNLTTEWNEKQQHYITHASRSFL